MSTKGQNKNKIVGLGTSGSKVIDYILKQGVSEVDCIAVDIYAVALGQSKARIQLSIGSSFLHGGGSGGDPRMGQKTAEESATELRNVLSGAHEAFIVCGLSGGIGAGASSIIANLAKEGGAATVGIVYNPSGFEGIHRQCFALSTPLSTYQQRLFPGQEKLVILAKDSKLCCQQGGRDKNAHS